MSECIDISQDDGILSLRLNRPDKKNAIDIGMYQTLADTLKAADLNPDIRIVYISGAGDAFCAGNDLNDFLKNRPKDQSAPVFQFVTAIANFEKPIVAAVSGLAVGIGTTLLLHCDLVYADDTAKFILPFVQLGVCPELGSSLLLPLLCGKQRASEILLCGEPITVQDAKSMGFVNQIAERESLHSTALARAEMMAKLPSNALMASKRLIRQSLKAQLDQAIHDESEEFLRLLDEDECKDILAGFFKR